MCYQGDMNLDDIAKTIDHALLQPGLTDREFDAGCDVALRYRVAALCVKSSDVVRATRNLSNGTVKVCAVVGFPHGNTTVAVTCQEAMLAMDEGAVEVDAVVALSRALSGDFTAVNEQVVALNECVTARGGLLKMIFETGLIAEPKVVIRLCEICKAAKVAYVKTSTGFATVKASDGSLRSAGATPDDVALLVKHARPVCQVKASGGIRTLADVMVYLDLGATRIGTGSTADILRNAE